MSRFGRQQDQCISLRRKLEIGTETFKHQGFIKLGNIKQPKAGI